MQRIEWRAETSVRPYGIRGSYVTYFAEALRENAFDNLLIIAIFPHFMIKWTSNAISITRRKNAMYDVLIIGCGVSGAACAYALSKYELSLCMIDASNDVSNGTSKANSAIIHAGYDPKPGSLMARLNVEGNAMAGDICEKLDVPFKRIGSLVLGFNEADRAHLQKLYERGVANAVPGIALLSAEEVKAMEPNIADNVVGALYAPSAGVISPWEYTLAMAETAVKNGAEIYLSTRAEAIESIEGGYKVKTNKGDFETRYIISAVGVDAERVRSMLEEPGYKIVPTRGQYFLLDKSEGGIVNHVIFQCPDEKGKGVLVSPTVHGNLIVGPDAEKTAADDRASSAAGLDRIAATARRSVPSLNVRQNIRNFAGVRANSDRDEFIIEESAAFPGFIDLAGIKSPGLSAAPAIGEYVADMIKAGGKLRFEEKKGFIDSRRRIRFAELSHEEKAKIVGENPAYGRIVCRCETVTEGEIVDALHSPIPPVSVNAVKRRVGAGMGRCQGGFCSAIVHQLISRELGIPMEDIPKEDEGSYILVKVGE